MAGEADQIAAIRGRGEEAGGTKAIFASFLDDVFRDEELDVITAEARTFGDGRRKCQELGDSASWDGLDGITPVTEPKLDRDATFSFCVGNPNEADGGEAVRVLS